MIRKGEGGRGIPYQTNKEEEMYASPSKTRATITVRSGENVKGMCGGSVRHELERGKGEGGKGMCGGSVRRVRKKEGNVWWSVRRSIWCWFLRLSCSYFGSYFVS